MSDVHLITAMFASVNRLTEILHIRQIPFTCTDTLNQDPQTSASNCETLIISDDYMNKVGKDAVISFAKSVKASQICAVSQNQPEFGISSELGGKLLNLRLPDAKEDVVAEDYGLQMLITLISDERVVAASDEKSLKLFELAKRVARTDVTVFINGPTGTGKEVLSKLVHNHSKRSEAPFVAVNCAAIPENMLEALLFGHEKGSFTGASTTNKGIFRAADGGTLLLDEISEMPLSLQAKLLRVLQEKRVMAVGGANETPVDVRIIATTNRDMREEVKASRFREDLFYRLNVFPINTLALRDRTKDIIPIAANMVFKLDQQSNTHTLLTGEAIDALLQYDWPGNVRELGNVIHRAHILSSGNKITTADLIFDGYVAEGSMNTADALAAKLQNEKA